MPRLWMEEADLYDRSAELEFLGQGQGYNEFYEEAELNERLITSIGAVRTVSNNVLMHYSLV